MIQKRHFLGRAVYQPDVIKDSTTEAILFFKADVFLPECEQVHITNVFV